MKKDKVAILGFVSHHNQAPFDDESFEIWGINDLYTFSAIKRWDRWFQIHNLDYYRGSDSRVTVPEMLVEYAKWDCPIYMVKKNKDIPCSVEFPFQEMVDKYGNYFNNTISWLIAFAISEGFKEIHIYGVDMADRTEYGQQRPSCEYFIGLARGMGIKVVLPEESGLLKVKYLYGLEAERENMEKKDLLQRRQNVEIQMANAQKKAEEAQAMINQCRGALVALDELLQTL